MEKVPKAQDHFFNAKKSQFAERNKDEKKNLKLKRELLKKVEAFKLTKNRADDLNKLKGFSEEWRAIGFVPRKNMDELVNSFSKAMDTHYDALSADRSERSVANYSDRVERLAQGGERDIKREQSILRDKINRLNARISSTEENKEEDVKFWRKLDQTFCFLMDTLSKNILQKSLKLRKEGVVEK